MKTITYNNIKVVILSQAGFAKKIGITDRTLLNWLAAGIVLPPVFEDKNRIIKLRGENHTAKYYLEVEGNAVKMILVQHGKKKADTFPKELIENIHSVMRGIRQSVLEGKADLMEYPLLLQFTGYKDLVTWLDNFNLDSAQAQKIYMAGNKIINEDRNK